MSTSESINPRDIAITVAIAAAATAIFAAIMWAPLPDTNPADDLAASEAVALPTAPDGKHEINPPYTRTLEDGRVIPRLATTPDKPNFPAKLRARADRDRASDPRVAQDARRSKEPIGRRPVRSVRLLPERLAGRPAAARRVAQP